LGLKTSKYLSRSIASSEAMGNIVLKDFFLGIFVLEIMLAARGDYID
jgi:hypothetical protein